MKVNLPLNLSSSLWRNIEGINQHDKFEQMKHSSLPEGVGMNKCKTLLSKANKVALSGIFLLFSFFLFSPGLFAQITGQDRGNGVRDNIRKKVAIAKTAGKVFEQVKLFDDNSKSGVENFKEQVSKGVTFDINLQLTADFLENKYEQVTLEIPGAEGSGPMLLELVRSKVLANDFNLFTSGAPKVPVKYDGGIHYQGIVAGNKESLVAISVFPEMVMGLIVTKQGNYNLGRVEGQHKKHILFLNADLKENEQFICGTVDDGISYLPSQLANNPLAFVSSCPVRVYVEIDNSVYLGWSSNLTNTTNFVTGLFNQSFVIYANEDIEMVISELVIWTTPDPYASGNTSGFLTQFQANTGAFNGDIGHLIALQNIGGLAAGFAGLCNPNTDLSLCFSGLSGLGFNTVPTYSFNVFLIAHEMGHLLGSRHTHACVWNGNSTAIDGCFGSTEGGCALPPSPAGGGTIMSQCHNSVGIDFTQGFGPQPGNVIRNSVSNAACLTSCCVATTIITCPANITVNNTSGLCGANVTFPPATANGTPAPTITYSNASGSFFAVGTTTVTATATNDCGTASCTFTVTVNDNEPPVITAPPVFSCFEAGNFGCSISLGASATDNCELQSLNSNAPACFPLGTTTVTWTATDINGNVSTKTQTVTRNPEINVNICAGPTRTIYRGTTSGVGPFGPQSVKLTSTASGGTPGYSYSWLPVAGLSNSNIANPVASPAVTTTYTLTVTDSKGCTRSLGITINVLPLSAAVCSGSADNVKFLVCHIPIELPSIPVNICISVNALKAHLTTGTVGHKNCYLGPCQQLCFSTASATRAIVSVPVKVNEVTMADETEGFKVIVYPNPSASDFIIQVNSNSDEPVTIRIMDVTGLVRSVRTINSKTNTIKMGGDLIGGTYIAEVIQGSNRKVVKLTKLN